MTQSFTTPVGIDISKDTFDACIRFSADHSYSKSFANSESGFNALLKWLHKHQCQAPLIAVEATGTYALPLLYFLSERAFRVAQLNPRHVKDFARSLGRRIKTDRIDAQIIAHFIECVPPRRWTPPPLEVRELQALMRRRAQLVNAKTAASNREKSLRISDQGTESWAFDSLTRELAFLKEEIDQIANRISELVKSSVYLSQSETLLRSIPGIGRIVALTILSEVPFILCFARAREVSSFAGLTATVQESGSSVRRKGRMSKEGSSQLRKQFYMAAMVTLRSDNPFRTKYDNLKDRGKPSMVAINALMNKTMRTAYGVLKHQTPFVEKFAAR